MYKNSIALIPARKGSKRLVGKNKKMLGGKPLISWTIEAAIQSECFSEIVVSTDDPDIMDIAESLNVTIEKRSDKLGEDSTTVTEVLFNLLKKKSKYIVKAQVCSVLLPTVPFRKAEHIREAFSMFNKDVSSVISMKEYEFPPQFAFSLDDNKVTPFNHNSLSKGKTRSQDQRPLYHPNGGIYISWVNNFLISASFFSGNIQAYVMDDVSSLDIDTDFEYKLAKFIIENNWHKKYNI